MEFHPVKQCVVSDRAGVGGPLAQGFPVAFSAAADVAWRNGGKGRQFHGAGLDLRGTGAIPAPGPHFGPAPQPEGHGDIARRHSVPQVLAELHPAMLGLLPPARPAARPGSAHGRTDHPALRHHGRHRRVPVSRAYRRISDVNWSRHQHRRVRHGACGMVAMPWLSARRAIMIMASQHVRRPFRPIGGA